MHLLAQLRRLERKYRDELVVVGVHSAKFNAEKATEAIHQAIRRYGVEHPVVNDRDFVVWQSYAIRAWPTLMFISPEGRVLGKYEGEAPFDALDRLVGEMVREFDGRGVLDRRPLDFLRREPLPAAGLAFPGKLLADAASSRLYLSDTGHHRVVEADLAGTVLRVFGVGEAGLRDGAAVEARFHAPQGLALGDGRLYVADAENHALRAIDLAEGRVTTLAGTGEQAMARLRGGPGREVPLSSPYDLALAGSTLYVAMAGLHQLWAFSLVDGTIRPYAGTGREGIADGPRASADFAQPFGITTDGERLWVADSETSAVRQVDLRDGQVTTLVGLGLFVFGDEDGVGDSARLQHVEGIAWHQGALYLADTYNNKIKRLDPASRRVTTLAGQPEPGCQDGPGEQAHFDEPGDVSAADGRLYVADTNNHAVRLIDLAGGTVSTLALRGLDELRGD